MICQNSHNHMINCLHLQNFMKSHNIHSISSIFFSWHVFLICLAPEFIFLCCVLVLWMPKGSRRHSQTLQPYLPSWREASVADQPTLTPFFGSSLSGNSFAIFLIIYKAIYVSDKETTVSFRCIFSYYNRHVAVLLPVCGWI